MVGSFRFGAVHLAAGRGAGIQRSIPPGHEAILKIPTTPRFAGGANPMSARAIVNRERGSRTLECARWR
jgi:hypothetical protein